MATIYQITVTNNSPSPQTMFFFQQPAKYSGSSTVYSNSLASQQIAAKPSVGTAQIQFTADIQIYAGVQTQSTPIEVSLVNTSSIAEVPIDVASSSNPNAKDMTTMSVDTGLALSAPVTGAGIEDGAFRIVTPTFNPVTTPYNAGLAALAQQNILLSNFVVANPNQNIDVMPQVIFYVATGSYTAGMVIDFDSVSNNAALCDATNGQEDFMVTYNADGTWTVK